MNARKSLFVVAALSLVSASAFAADPVLQDNRGGHDRAALNVVRVTAPESIGNRDRSGNDVVVKAATRQISNVAVNVAVPRDGSGS